LICSDKEQVIPTIDADQARALLNSGHGYIDVRCALNWSMWVDCLCLLEKLPWSYDRQLQINLLSMKWNESSGCERTLTRPTHLVLTMFPTTCQSHLKVSFLIPRLLVRTSLDWGVLFESSWYFQIELSFGNFVRFSLNLH
jgi:hypothetical protein